MILDWDQPTGIADFSSIPNTKEESSVLFVSQTTYPYHLFDNTKIDIKKIIMKEIARIQFQRKSNGKIQKNTIFVVS